MPPSKTSAPVRDDAITKSKLLDHLASQNVIIGKNGSPPSALLKAVVDYVGATPANEMAAEAALKKQMQAIHQKIPIIPRPAHKYYRPEIIELAQKLDDTLDAYGIAAKPSLSISDIAQAALVSNRSDALLHSAAELRVDSAKHYVRPWQRDPSDHGHSR